jgi:membrane protease YdiL (CAAX protease family)
MSIGTSLVLIAVGAVLRWAVTIHWHASTINWRLIGDILMVLGVIGLVLALIWTATASRRAGRTVVVEDRTNPPTY